jgi:hypothetical protein
MPIIIALVFMVPVTMLIKWSMNKSGKLKQGQIDNWAPLADQLGGTFEEHQGRWQHHVLRAPLGGAQVVATISHQVIADAKVASSLRTNNEFRTQVHAEVVHDGPTFFLSGTKPGKGTLSVGPDDVRDRFKLSKDTGFEQIASPAALQAMQALWPHFRDGAQLVSGGNMVSLLFASNTTEGDVIQQAMILVGEIAGAQA